MLGLFFANINFAFKSACSGIGCSCAASSVVFLAAWNRDHLVVLWDGGSAGETGLTLSRYATNGERQGASIAVPTASPATRLYVVAHDGTVGFTWSEEVAGGYTVYFQQARSCP